MIFIVVGVLSALSSGIILVPDLIRTVKTKQNQMSCQYLITKSVSVGINFVYGFLLYDNYGLVAGLPIILTMSVKTFSLVLFALYTNTVHQDESEHLIP